MASVAPFFERLKPALDNFLKSSTRDSLQRLENEICAFNWLESKIVHVHILLPLVLKLEELNGKDQELRTGLINCMRLVISNIYLNDVKSLSTILAIILKQVRDLEKATALGNLSEENKLAAVNCICTAFERSTSDVLEAFYTKKSASLLGHILLLLVELIEREKYRKLKLNSIDCLAAVFYVHKKAEITDIVLRNQVADTLFIYLPKVIGVLFKISIADEKLGETLKSNAIETLGRILHLIYEDTNEIDTQMCYSTKEFRKLLSSSALGTGENNACSESLVLEGSKFDKGQLEQMLSRLQTTGRSSQWFKETSLRMSGIFRQMAVLRSHPSHVVRHEFAEMCSKLLEHCAQNLKQNFLILLENLIALAEDENETVAQTCASTLKRLQQQGQQQCSKNFSIFDECADTLFEQHGLKLLQIVQRKNEAEMYAELLFLKGFLQNINATKLQTIFCLNTFLHNFCMALITAVDLDTSTDFLNEEYALRQFDESVNLECFKLKWRRFRFLETERCIRLLEKICALLGSIKEINNLMFDFIFELFQDQGQHRMNEALLILTWMFAPEISVLKQMHKKVKIGDTKFSNLILNEIFNDIHWNLALHADATTHLKVKKPSYWFVDRTPGLYESAYEMRVQDYDSDDEQTQDESQMHVTIWDAQWNVLHTCMVLDALGHFASFLGSTFRPHVFRSLHKVLLKVASSNTLVYQAGIFALMSLQNALGYDNTTIFIESHTDYISYHLNMLLRRTPDSSSAVDILSVVLQLSTQHSLPHLETIFETLRNECSKTNQTHNISAFLRVFNAFLANVARWQAVSEMEITKQCLNETTGPINLKLNANELVNNWLQLLENDKIEGDLETSFRNETVNNEAQTKTENCDDENMDVDAINKTELPRHIQMAKQIIQETLKFLSNSNQTQQIQTLECLIAGVPLLRDYEDELLPLVHTIWQPLLEKFRQKDPLVLNRCFTLLNVLSTHAKDFIHRRSLDDVIPYLKDFLRDSAAQSAMEHLNAQTQLYKLQFKLLQEFSNLIISMQIDGRHLNDIAEVIASYLSEKQPKELQISALQFFVDLSTFNGPLIYLIALKKLHLKDFKRNVEEVLRHFGI